MSARLGNAVTYTSGALELANRVASSPCLFASTGPWLVTASTSSSQFFSAKYRTTSGIFPCASTVTPKALSKTSLK